MTISARRTPTPFAAQPPVPAAPPPVETPTIRKRKPSERDSAIPGNYSGRVLQRSAFRSLVGRRRTPGSAISSVLIGLRRIPPAPRRPESPTVGTTDATRSEGAT